MKAPTAAAKTCEACRADSHPREEGADGCCEDLRSARSAVIHERKALAKRAWPAVIRERKAPTAAANLRSVQGRQLSVRGRHQRLPRTCEVCRARLSFARERQLGSDHLDGSRWLGIHEEASMGHGAWCATARAGFKGLERWGGFKHYKGKTFEDTVTSVPVGVDSSDWQTMCEKWNTREEQDIAERNRQNRTHQKMTYRRGHTSIYQLKDDFVKTHQREPDRMKIFRMGRGKDVHDRTQQWVDDESNDHFRRNHMTTPSVQSDDVSPISVEDAFIAVMGWDKPGRVHCTDKAETFGNWYGRREGSSSSDGYHTQVHQLQNQNKKMEELCAERSRDLQELHDICNQMSEMRALTQRLAGQPSHVSPPAVEGSDVSTNNYDDNDD
ncbi:hypothetical protein Taro_043328 [Colocasia esculenta]|uniref:Uncharacterized protein n=1 Tax=Colocasia esculenta TaxID=4460 RepID=A0A843X1A4_COLES|nr:hypothetical protein [Colocasia esculenta]